MLAWNVLNHKEIINLSSIWSKSTMSWDFLFWPNQMKYRVSKISWFILKKLMPFIQALAGEPNSIAFIHKAYLYHFIKISFTLTLLFISDEYSLIVQWVN